MELDELKEKWNILSEEIANQKIVTQTILEKAVNDKVKTMVSDYKYLSILAFVLVFVMFFLIIKFDSPYKVFTIIIGVVTVVFLIWGLIALNILKKSISPILSLCDREEKFLRYKKHEKLCYILMVAVYIPIIIAWSIIFDNNRGFPLWLFIVRVTILFVIPCFISYIYSRRRMRKIEESFVEYKEFMKE